MTARGSWQRQIEEGLEADVFMSAAMQGSWRLWKQAVMWIRLMKSGFWRIRLY